MLCIAREIWGELIDLKNFVDVNEMFVYFNLFSPSMMILCIK